MADRLPVEEVLPELLAALRHNQAVVLTAPPGAGKTTRVPGAILDGALLGEGRLMMLEPRRLAARAAANAIARLRGEAVGNTVGYEVRFDRAVSAATRILVVTEGILTRRLIEDPLLEGVSCVIIDEFHERSLHVDLALAFLRELLEARPELRLVVMSATLDASAVSRFLGDCPIVSAEGRQFPLTVEHATRADDRPLHVRTAAALFDLLERSDDDGGDVLVFLPGAGEIRMLAAHLAGKRGTDTLELLELHGSLPAAEQDRALQLSLRRRVILSTNIAETSLTLPKVTTVIDTGLVKVLSTNPRTGLDRLELARVSQASATQRAGRAGRIAAGRVYRLWTEVEHRALALADIPEIKRVDLALALLAVLAFHPGDPRRFPFFERPADLALTSALDLLERQGAILHTRNALTRTGVALASLPVHPRVGALLLAAREFGCVGDGAALGALVGQREILQGERGRLEADIELRLERLLAFAGSGATKAAALRLGLHFGAATDAHLARQQLMGLAERLPRPSAPTQGSRPPLCALLLKGFPERVCQRTSTGGTAVMVGGRKLTLSAESAARLGPLFVALDLEEGRREQHSTARVTLGASLELDDLHRYAKEHLAERQSARFDPISESVCGVTQTVFIDLVLSEQRSTAVPPEVLAATLAENVGRHFTRWFQPSPNALLLLERLRFARRHLPEAPWPDLSQAAIAGQLEALCLGRRSLAELQRIDWHAELLARLDSAAGRLLDAEVPERLRVPSGNHILIDYSAALQPGGAPVLAVKLQELFGLALTPRICRGRVPLTLHLLAPNGRPVQVTQDLKSFWSTTYREVRGQLLGRYPKHPWPEDPLAAAPTAGIKRRR